MFNPLLATLSNRPSLSTSITVAWGTILMVLAAITRRTIAINPKNKKVSRTSIIFASVTGNGTRGKLTIAG
jgi:hypothetical protein